MKTYYLHVGFHKTATTTFQQICGKNRDKLKESGITSVASRVDGVNRYTLVVADQDGHRHPHFICDDCGDIMCLPVELTAAMHLEGPWSTAVKLAKVQLRGECPECINSK